MGTTDPSSNTISIPTMECPYRKFMFMYFLLLLNDSLNYSGIAQFSRSWKFILLLKLCLFYWNWVLGIMYIWEGELCYHKHLGKEYYTEII